MHLNLNAQQKLALRLFGVFIGSVLFFGAVYFGLTYVPGHGLKPPTGKVTVLDCFYFSVVTITTLGYGDIAPMGASRVFACFEAMFGLAFAGYAISQVVSMRQEALIEYLTRDRFVQTYNECLEQLKDAKELIADRRRQIQAKVPIVPIDFVYNRSNPFYPALRAVEMLNGYTDHIQSIGEAEAMSDRITRGAHHIEELAGFTRKYINLLVSHNAPWHTSRTVLIVRALCDALDAFSERYIGYTRYASELYKGGDYYRVVLKRHTAHMRSNL